MTNVARMSTLIGIARAAIGVGYMIAPTRSHTTLAGRDAELPTTRAASRTFGIREIYVGGSVVAAQAWAPRAVVPLLLAGVAIDAWDTAAFAMSADVPRGMRSAGVAVAGASTVGGIAATIAATAARPRLTRCRMLHPRLRSGLSARP